MGAIGPNLIMVKFEPLAPQMARVSANSKSADFSGCSGMARPLGARYLALKVFLYRGSTVPTLGRRGHLLYGGLGNGSRHGALLRCVGPIGTFAIRSKGHFSAKPGLGFQIYHLFYRL